jgi:O-antigen/teichoic acid export membrane protein
LYYGLIFILNKGIELAKKTYIISIINILGLLLNFILNFIFIPEFGLFAASVNLVLALVFILITTSFYSKKHYGISVDFASIFIISIIGIIFYLISLLFIKYNLVIFIFIKIVLLVLFLFFVFVSLFSYEEKKAVTDFIKTLKKK